MSLGHLIGSRTKPILLYISMDIISPIHICACHFYNGVYMLEGNHVVMKLTTPLGML